jgi:hypothetical protein
MVIFTVYNSLSSFLSIDFVDLGFPFLEHNTKSSSQPREVRFKIDTSIIHPSAKPYPRVSRAQARSQAPALRSCFCQPAFNYSNVAPQAKAKASHSTPITIRALVKKPRLVHFANEDFNFAPEPDPVPFTVPASQYLSDSRDYKYIPFSIRRSMSVRWEGRRTLRRPEIDGQNGRTLRILNTLSRRLHQL